MQLEFSSFRDPAGYVFERDGVLYRSISPCYFDRYDHLMRSGLYNELVQFHALVPHEECPLPNTNHSITIKPIKIPFISYPYEWSFDQLKDAAILTLKIHRRAMRHEMILKDASAYNIQFVNGNAILIDTLSFDFYQNDMPWGAYGQFCRHFLAPLILMSEIDLRLNTLLQNYIDGIPLDIADALLKGRGGFFAAQHIHLHSKSIAKHSNDGDSAHVNTAIKPVKLSSKAHIALIESMIVGIENLIPNGMRTEWANYYAHTNYDAVATDNKKIIVQEFIKEAMPETVWDFGANDGTFSRLALDVGASVVAFDMDPAAVNNNYRYAKTSHIPMLPLVMDFINPSPAIGFYNSERLDVWSRQRPDCIMALALIHHLAISNNLPLELLASWFAQSTAKYLIIEFVPKEDSQVQKLLSTRSDIFPSYCQPEFERAFSKWFTCKSLKPIANSLRTLYLYEKRAIENEAE